LVSDWLNAAGSTENTYAAVEHLERTVDLDGEVDVSRGIDDIQAVVVPLATGCRGLDSNAALLFLIHEVGGELQNSLGGRCFTGVNMGENADIAVTLQVSHCGIQSSSLKNLFAPGLSAWHSQNKNRRLYCKKDAKTTVNY
jgi:hypothetical protein